MSDTAIGRAYAVLLRALPQDFRARYGAEMRHFFEDAWRESSALGRCVILPRAIADVAWTAFAVRMSPGSYAAPSDAIYATASARSGLATDARMALRGLRRRPGFTATAVITAALGVAATTAVFSVVDTTVLHGVGVPDERRVLTLWGTFTNSPGSEFLISLAEYADLRTDVRSFARVGAWSVGSLLLEPSGDQPARTVDVASTYGDIYTLVGARTAVGRLPGPDDDRLGAPDVVVISHGLWTTMFGADPRVIGVRTIPTGSQPARIIGVLAPNVALPGQRVDMWVHRVPNPATWAANRSGHGLNVLGLLRAGATEAVARAELRSLQHTWAERYAGQHSFGIDGHDVSVASLGDRMLGPARRVAVLLSISSIVLLLLACANVANLLLARGETRTSEVGVRIALGASHRRVAQPVIIEGLAIAAAGGALGLVLAAVGLPSLMRLAPRELIDQAPPHIDARLVAFTIVVSLLTGVLFAIAPARRAGRQDASVLVRASGRASAAMRGLRLLVAGQTALATLLLVAAALLTQSLHRLNAVNPGFDASSRVSLDIVLPPGHYRDASTVIGFYDDLQQRVEAIGGVAHAAFIKNLPLRDGQRIENVVREGDAHPDKPVSVAVQATSPGVLRALGIPLLNGRDIESGDRLGAPRVAVVNASAAATLWPGQSALGKRVRALFAPDSVGLVTVVGVYGDVRSNSLSAAPMPEIILPVAQGDVWPGWLRRIRLVVQTSSTTASMTSSLRGVIRDVDPYVVSESPTTMTEVLRASTARQRFLATLIAVFAALALVIAGVGVFGVVSFAVARQTRELAIRSALGAGRGDIFGSVLRANAGAASGGAIVGAVIATAIGPALSAFLYGVSPRGLVVLAGGPLVLIAIAVLACLAPAIRATRVPAVRALQDAE